MRLIVKILPIIFFLSAFLNAVDVYQLEDFVVTTATKRDRLVSEVPIKTEVINLDSFRCFNVSDLGESLEHFNGIRTESNCQNCGTAEIQLLGLPGNYNQVLISGMPLFTGISSVYGIDQIPTIFLEQIEVTKGGGSSLYGAGAVAGVINLIPEAISNEHSHFITSFTDIDGSSANRIEFLNTFSNKNESISFLIYGKDAQQEAYDRDLDGFTELVERENSSLGSIFLYKPNEAASLKLSSQINKEYRRGGSTLEMPNEYSQVSESLKTDYKWAILEYNRRVNENLNLNVSTALVDFDRKSFYGGTGEEIIVPDDGVIDFTQQTYNDALGNENAVLGSDASKAFALFGNRLDGKGGGSFNQFGILVSELYFFDMSLNFSPQSFLDSKYHNFTVGFQYEIEDIYDENVNLLGERINILHDDKFKNTSLYFQDEWKVNDFNELLIGGRIDNANTLEKKIFSPRLAWIFDYSKNIKLRANYSTGFLSPRIFSEDIHISNLGGVPIDVVNGDNLKQEGSETLSFGWDYDNKSTVGRSLSSMQLYYTRLDNSFLIKEPGSQPILEDGRIKVERINTSGAHVFGIEFDFEHYLSSNSQIYFGIAYNRSRFNDNQEVFSGIYSKVFNKVPDFSGILQYRKKFNKDFNFVSSLKWTGASHAFKNTNETIHETSDFFVLDLALSKAIKFKQWPALDVTLSLNNILDSYQSDFESGVLRDAEYVYGPRKPRNISLSAEMEF